MSRVFARYAAVRSALTYPGGSRCTNLSSYGPFRPELLSLTHIVSTHPRSGMRSELIFLLTKSSYRLPCLINFLYFIGRHLMLLGGTKTPTSFPMCTSLPWRDVTWLQSRRKHRKRPSYPSSTSICLRKHPTVPWSSQSALACTGIRNPMASHLRPRSPDNSVQPFSSGTDMI